MPLETTDEPVADIGGEQRRAGGLLFLLSSGFSLIFG